MVHTFFPFFFVTQNLNRLALTIQWLLPYIIVLQFLFLLAWLWFVTRTEYFSNIFSGVVIFTVLSYAAYLLVEHYSPVFAAGLIHNPVFVKLSGKLYNHLDLKYLNKRLLIVNLSAVFLGSLWIYNYRSIYPKIQEKIYVLKRRLYDNGKADNIPAVKDLPEYLSPGKFFFGLSDQGPVYLSCKDLTLHVQVVGPSGAGKTKSVLFPLAMQAIKQGVPLIFVDGKGDSALIRDFMAADPEILVFSPLTPLKSHSYNPLTSSNDSAELMNMLAAGLDIDAPGEAKYYTDIQKKYLLSLISLFISTGKRFNFSDIVDFTNFDACRGKVCDMPVSVLHKQDLTAFWERLSKNQKELIGLITLIDQLFVSDERISGIVNSYNPDIDIKSIMTQGKRAIFSFSTGKKAQTNEALAKMVLADIANAVGERHAGGDTGFMLLILDEFGQYASPSFDKFISTCRSANVGVVLSHQSNAQLHTKDGSDRLAQIVRENTATKVILRQAEEADFWAETFGTKSAFKHTEQTEGGAFGTEKISETGSIREVDEFIVHPNAFRQLPVGRAVFKSKHNLPVLINCGMWPVNNIEEVKLYVPQKDAIEGLNLRAGRLNKIAGGI